MIRRMFVGAVSVMAALAVSAQTEVSQYQPGVTLDGVTYFLPRTALRVVVKAEKQVFTPGELNRYAERSMRISDAKTESEVCWRIKDVSVEAYGVPDTSKVYSIALRPKTVAPYVSLTKDGRILGIRDEGKDVELSPLPERVPAKMPVDAHRYFTREMNSAASKAKLAELVAQEIYDIRESYNALTRGEADNTPKDGAQLQLMLNSLDVQQQALMSLFTGTTATSTEVFSFNVIPGGACEKLLVARFSKHLGLVDIDDLAGAPLYMSVRPLETLPAVADNPLTAKKKGKMGVYYNVSVRAQVSVYDIGTVYEKIEMPMAQLGRTEMLSNMLFDKNVATRVVFSGVTGGLLHLDEGE